MHTLWRIAVVSAVCNFTIILGLGAQSSWAESGNTCIPAAGTCIALNPDVREDTILKTICVPGYTATVRPSTSYTNGLKLKLLREKGEPPENANLYELDHYIPLALGGHPRSPTNLWLQEWHGDDGAKSKDKLERKLHCLVCTGRVTLTDARNAIAKDWKQARQQFGHTWCSRRFGASD
jgi:hypothetical protein